MMTEMSKGNQTPVQTDSRNQRLRFGRAPCPTWLTDTIELRRAGDSISIADECQAKQKSHEHPRVHRVAESTDALVVDKRNKPVALAHGNDGCQQPCKGALRERTS